jgi:ATP-dependent DNA ligase
LKEYFEEIVKKGGEGVMLRKPNSMYEEGRSKGLKKYKVCVIFRIFFNLKGIL